MPSQRTVTTHHLMRPSANFGRSPSAQLSVELCRWSWPDNTKTASQRISNHLRQDRRTRPPNPTGLPGLPKSALRAAQDLNSRRIPYEPYLMKTHRGWTLPSTPRMPSIRSTDVPSSRSSANAFQVFGTGCGQITESPRSSMFGATTSPRRSFKAAQAQDKAAPSEPSSLPSASTPSFALSNPSLACEACSLPTAMTSISSAHRR